MEIPDTNGLTKEAIEFIGKAFLDILSPEASRVISILPVDILDEHHVRVLQSYHDRFTRPAQEVERDPGEESSSGRKARRHSQLDLGSDASDESAGTKNPKRLREVEPDQSQRANPVQEVERDPGEASSRARKAKRHSQLDLRSDASDESAGTKNPKHLQGRERNHSQRAQPKDSYGKILALHELKEHQVLREHWESKPKDSPALPLLCLPQVQGRQYNSLSEIIIACCFFLQERPPPSIENLRRLLLLHYVGLQVQEMRRTDSQVSDQSLLDNGLKKEDFSTIVHMGERVAWFCEQIGSLGGLFYLSKEMDSNFIKNRMTKKGKAFDEMKARLKDLGLGTLIQEQRIQELSESVTNHLNEVFRRTATTEVEESAKEGEE